MSAPSLENCLEDREEIQPHLFQPYNNNFTNMATFETSNIGNTISAPLSSNLQSCPPSNRDSKENITATDQIQTLEILNVGDVTAAS